MTPSGSISERSNTLSRLLERTSKALGIAALLILLGGCQAAPKAPLQAKEYPQRIISLLPSGTELIYAVGQGHKVVGVTLNDNFPPEVAELPKVGDQTIDLEKVLALEPDLVVLDASFNKNKASLERLGINYLELNCQRLHDIAPAMRELGRVLGCQEQAEEASKAFKAELDSFVPLQKKQPVFVEIWSDPLMTVGSETLVDDILNLVGVENSYHDQTGYFQVDPEDVVSRQPTLIVFPRPEGLAEQSRALQLLEQVGLSPRIIVVDPDLIVRPSPRILTGAANLKNSIMRLD